jgi:hypothetical protein
MILGYAQDPAYTKIDESVLEGPETTVLDDPRVFLEVDDSTVVISCAAGLPVKQIISDLAPPAVMILDRIYENEPEVIKWVSKQKYNFDWSRVCWGSWARTQTLLALGLRKMIHNFYEELEFPGDVEHFGNLAIYVRQTAMSPPNYW